MNLISFEIHGLKNNHWLYIYVMSKKKKKSNTETAKMTKPKRLYGNSIDRYCEDKCEAILPQSL